MFSLDVEFDMLILDDKHSSRASNDMLSRINYKGMPNHDFIWRLVVELFGFKLICLQEKVGRYGKCKASHQKKFNPQL